MSTDEQLLQGTTGIATPAKSMPSVVAEPLVLVCNRGEIARRVLRTCAKLGIKSLSVYTKPDALAPHAREASFSVCLGDNPREYTNKERLLQIIREYGVTAVHPGYGFLSENEEFCEAVAEAGVEWLGPRAKTMHDFALKHVARGLAENAGVPVLTGSPLLSSVAEATTAAAKVGYPVLLKATGGGGGMGIYICRDQKDVEANFETSQKQGQAFFGNDGVFLEKYIEEAHHVEVQIFGDGEGGCVHLGERECSIQRRHQKVLEETPSPLVDSGLRSRLTEAAVSLGRSCCYRSAGTVEFLVDGITKDFFFLEVNARLQVEHGITEMVHGCVDIVEMQMRLQIPGLAPEGGVSQILKTLGGIETTGHAIEVRINGEDPARGFQPTPGDLGLVEFPVQSRELGVRVDSWVETGTRVSPHYDSLLAKLMVWAPTRQEAVQKMAVALQATKLQGTPNNLQLLKAVVDDSRFKAGDTTTKFLQGLNFQPRVVEVLAPGTQSSIQDWPGRTGMWHVGVPPSGPMDSLAHRTANALVGNEEDAAGLEFSVVGPTLRFHARTLIALTGAQCAGATLDGQPVGWWQSIQVSAGQVLALGAVNSSYGLRGYLAVAGGIDVPLYLGSRSTFPSGKFGGYQGRCLRMGDSLPLADPQEGAIRYAPLLLPPGCCPAPPTPCAGSPAGGAVQWEVGVLPGPHADPDYVQTEFMDGTFYTQPYSVHYSSNRLGVRLEGPKPVWVRSDGGDGGTHPSNVHDHVYAIGAINFTGDHPVVLTVDGPSLGGFVCPATIISTELWKVGQMRPGDSVLFKKLDLAEAHTQLLTTDAKLAAIRSIARGEQGACTPSDVLKHVARAEATVRNGAAAVGAAASMPPSRPLIHRLPATDAHPGVEFRLAGDRYIQVEYGPMELDLTLRVRVHCLEEALKQAKVPGLLETSPGVRSCMIEYDMRTLHPARLLEILLSLDATLPQPHDMTLPSRIIKLPMAFDDKWTHGAIAKYMKSIRPEAPYLPSNIEYIAKNNLLDGGKDEVRDVLFSASYLVLGLGDVYLGAPCAVPMDPRHRIVTTKYNPARTFTEEGTVGIGGSYMCIYPMDSPGGYQLVGRTLPIWNTFGRAGPFSPSKPWLLQYFDQVQFYRVSEEELEALREQFSLGRHELNVTPAVFDVAAYTARCDLVKDEVQALKAKQRAGMDMQLAAEEASLARLAAKKAESPTANGPMSTDDEEDDSIWDTRPGCCKVMAMFTANVWDVCVKVGTRVAAGDVLVVLEAMKMETPITSPKAGTVVAVKAQQSKLASAGTLLVVVQEEP